MVTNKKIIVIIPYFGKWPSYFNLFLKGCENNPWLNILFFTDCPIPQIELSNIIFHQFTLSNFSALATKKIGINFNVNKAYKLCDFRPCYGKIFEDYLQDYDYWGYGDIDLIYGNLQPFIINRINAGYDVLSNRAEILSGSLCLIRNTSYLKNLYAESTILINLLGSENYEGLDETALNHSTWQGGKKADLPRHSFTYLIDKANHEGKIKASFLTTCKEHIGNNEIINYKSGKILFEQNESAYYHYVCNKNKEEYVFPRWEIVPDTFWVSATGFYSDKKFYTPIHYFRKIFGFISNIAKRAWKRLIKK